MRNFVFILGLVCSTFLGVKDAPASETLADIRQDMSILYVEVQKLKRELSTTGASSIALPPGALDRINAIESELQRLTAKTEELEFRIGRIAEDGGRRVGDLEFRLCELEAGCDIGALGRGTTLGGDAGVSTPVTQPVPQNGGSELAIGEQSDFARASQALAKEDYQSAADQFAAFRATYPGGPLEPDALVSEGRALAGLGDVREAARRYLDAYGGYPNSNVAAEALWRLGASLATLGKTAEACVTLAEVSNRYPGSAAVTEAASEMATLGCQ